MRIKWRKTKKKMLQSHRNWVQDACERISCKHVVWGENHLYGISDCEPPTTIRIVKIPAPHQIETQYSHTSKNTDTDTFSPLVKNPFHSVGLQRQRTMMIKRSSGDGGGVCVLALSQTNSLGNENSPWQRTHTQSRAPARSMHYTLRPYEHTIKRNLHTSMFDAFGVIFVVVGGVVVAAAIVFFFCFTFSILIVWRRSGKRAIRIHLQHNL